MPNDTTIDLDDNKTSHAIGDVRTERITYNKEHALRYAAADFDFALVVGDDVRIERFELPVQGARAKVHVNELDL